MKTQASGHSCELSSWCIICGMKTHTVFWSYHLMEIYIIKGNGRRKLFIRFPSIQLERSYVQLLCPSSAGIRTYVFWIPMETGNHSPSGIHWDSSTRLLLLRCRVHGLNNYRILGLSIRRQSLVDYLNYILLVTVINYIYI